MKSKKNRIVILLVCMFLVSLCLTFVVSFSNGEEARILINSITPLYDKSENLIVDEKGVVFDDKNQNVKYEVELLNSLNYDVKVEDIELSIPTEEFLEYEIENLDKDEIVASNSTKKITVSFTTLEKEKWGRNFEDDLTAKVTFVKVTKEEQKPNPKPEDQKEDIIPPVKDTEEVKQVFSLIENYEIKEDELVFTNVSNVVDKQKIDVWIYSKPIYLGRFEVEVKDGMTKVLGLSDALERHNIEAGNHSLVFQTEFGDKIGYVEVNVVNNKFAKPVKDEIDLEEETLNNAENYQEKEEKSKKENNNLLFVLLVVVTGITGTSIVVILIVNKKAKTVVVVLILLSGVSLVKADKLIELSITFKVGFKSQNVMIPSYYTSDDGSLYFQNFWHYGERVKNFYIKNEMIEISDYVYRFDASVNNNGRVIAYLVDRPNDISCFLDDGSKVQCYDLYLIADGIIYPNTNASFYFEDFRNVEKIDNLEGYDTSEVTNMNGMFNRTAYFSEDFELDVSCLDTSKVENMSYMFFQTGYSDKDFTLDVSSFDTSNVTDMEGMFKYTGYTSEIFSLDLSNFDTSNVTNMSAMFYYTGYSSTNLNLDLSNFDTSEVTNMRHMFFYTGYNSTNFTLDLSKFDTSKVTNMTRMFYSTGYNSTSFTLDVSNFDTSKVTDMSYMFVYAGYNDVNFTLDVSNFDTSSVTNISSMFFYTGYNSTKLNTSLIISNPNLESYDRMFKNVATKSGSQIKINYILDTEELVKQMISTKSTNSNVVIGNLIVDVDKLEVGDEIHIAGEKFNIISLDDNVTLFAQYNLDTNYRQSTTYNGVTFSNSKGWEYEPGPKEVDIQIWSTNPKDYVNNYVSYLQTVLGDTTINGNLITLTELKNLGCVVPVDYAKVDNKSSRTCEGSPYSSWLLNDNKWWTSSAYADDSRYLWIILSGGSGGGYYYNNSAGVRPTITISKETLRNLG